MRVVFDANVVVAGVCWQGEGWLCLDLGKPFGIPIVRPARFLAMFHPP